MSEEKRPHFSIAALLLLTACTAIAVAIPRLLAGKEMHPATIVWFVSCHQVFMAVVLGIWIWICLGRRRRIALLIGTVIVVFWSPMILLAAELTLTGKNEQMIRITDTLRIKGFYNTFFDATYKWLGYNFVWKS